MGFYVYILKGGDGLYYTGHTDNWESCLAAHQPGEIPGYAQDRPRQGEWELGAAFSFLTVV
jgi:predicted GIY-YIG superfamily endonuclease